MIEPHVPVCTENQIQQAAALEQLVDGEVALEDELRQYSIWAMA
jgi:hypothetical protein